MFALSVVLPALRNPVALAIVICAGLVLAFHERLPYKSPTVRLSLAILAVASVAIVWVIVQPGYIGT